MIEIVLSLLTAALLNEIEARWFWFSDSLARLLGRLLPETKRARYIEEWRADLRATTGAVSRIFRALDLLRSGYAIRRDTEYERQRQRDDRSDIVILTHPDDDHLPTKALQQGSLAVVAAPHHSSKHAFDLECGTWHGAIGDHPVYGTNSNRPDRPGAPRTSKREDNDEPPEG